MRVFIKSSIIICLSIFYNTCFAQDMSGEWNGMLQQTDGGASNSYYFTLNLKHKGNVITGTSKVAFVNKPDIYAIMELKGKFKSDILIFEETKIIEQKTFKDFQWCVKKVKLTFTMKKDGFCIEGTWSGKASNGDFCAPGTIKICKIVPMANHQKEKRKNNYATVQLRTNYKIKETLPYQLSQ